MNRPKLAPPSHNPIDDPSPWLDPEAAAAYIGRTPGTLAQWRSKGVRLPFHRVGRNILYNRDDLDAFVQSGRVEVA